MNPETVTQATQIVNQTAQVANQVGLLTWLIVAITCFSGFLTVYVLYTSGKREEYYRKFADVHMEMLGAKVDGYKTEVKESMTLIQEANRMVKIEHDSMIKSIQKTAETLVQIAFIMKMKPDLDKN